MTSFLFFITLDHAKQIKTKQESIWAEEICVRGREKFYAVQPERPGRKKDRLIANQKILPNNRRFDYECFIRKPVHPGD
jgi:hypothetical protein